MKGIGLECGSLSPCPKATPLKKWRNGLILFSRWGQQRELMASSMAYGPFGQSWCFFMVMISGVRCIVRVFLSVNVGWTALLAAATQLMRLADYSQKKTRIDSFQFSIPSLYRFDESRKKASLISTHGFSRLLFETLNWLLQNSPRILTLASCGASFKMSTNLSRECRETLIKSPGIL